MLAATDKIDLVSKTDDGLYRIFVIAEKGEWLGEAETVAALFSDKMNAAASFVLDGQLDEMHPASVGKKVEIVFCSVDPIPPDWRHVLDQFEALLAKDGLPLVIQPLHFDRAA